MKKFLLTILTAMSIMPYTMAQTEETENQSAPLEQMLVYENPKIYVTIGDIVYKPQTTAQKAQNTIVGVIANQELSVEDESMVPTAKEEITNAFSQPFRFVLLQGEPNEQQKPMCLKLTATITGCNTTTKLRNGLPDKLVRIVAYIYLTYPETGEVKASQQVVGESWAGTYSSMNEAIKYAAHNLRVSIINQVNSWYPLRGHMLDKGFEKGKKQKLKEIYIDLGSDNGLGSGYNVSIYTVKRIAGRIARKYIGRGKVAEVMGGDISLVKLSKGADLIKQAFDNGAEIAISVY